jgi:hypothetical protein
VFQTQHSGRGNFRVLEIGTGWIPTVPLGLFLCGAEKIWTVDIDPLLDAERLKTMLGYYDRYDLEGKLRDFLPDFCPDRLNQVRNLIPQSGLSSPDRLLDRLGISVLVGDAQKLPLPSESIDYVFSNGVLEYIPPSILRGILKECSRLSAAGAVMTHRLNLIDQYSYFDNSITPYNFLKYTSAQWKILNSPLIWQNRLRISDFKKMIAESGFTIISQDNETGSLDDLAEVKLAPEFRHYTQEELLVLHSWITARIASA